MGMERGGRRSRPPALGAAAPPQKERQNAQADAGNGAVVSKGRRAGQPKGQNKQARDVAVPLHAMAAREDGSGDGMGSGSRTSRDRPISSPVYGKREPAPAFGRRQSVPDAPATEAQQRIRTVHQERGPYRTIQSALDGALEGDIISVAPGLYDEVLHIHLDTVRIVGKIRDGLEVVLRSSPESYSVRADRDAGNCRLENLVFRETSAEEPESGAEDGAKAGISALKNKMKQLGKGLAGVAKDGQELMHHDAKSGGYACMVARGRVTLLNCTFSGHTCGGVLVSGESAEALVFGCRFSSAPAGMAAVQVEERARARVRKCMFDKCLGMGIQVVRSECTIDDNSFSEMFNYAVQVAASGSGLVKANSFVSGRKSSVAISGRSAPQVEGNSFSKCYATGVFVFDGGRPTVEANEFRGCTLAAVEVRDEGSDPLVINNTVMDGSDGGIVVHNQARGTIKGNTISGNVKAGITMCTGASAIVCDNVIAGGKGSGILCHTDAGGVVRGNRISATEKAGIEMRKGAKTEVVANHVTGGLAQGIFVHSGACGHFESNAISSCKGPLVEVTGASDPPPVFEKNELVGGVGGGVGVALHGNAKAEIRSCLVKECARAGVHVSDGAAPLVEGNKIVGSGEHGIVVAGESVGASCRIVDNQVSGSQLAGIDVSQGAAPVVTRNVVERGSASGLHMHDGARGVFVHNTVRLNAKAGVTVRSGAEVTLTGNFVADGKATGVYVYDEGKLVMTEGNKIERNAFHGVAVRDRGVLEMTGSRLLKSGHNGLFVYADGSATVDKCDMCGSGNVGVLVCEGSSAALRHCKISQNGFEGVWVYEGAQCSVTNSDLRGNRGKPLRVDGDDCQLVETGNKVL